MGITRGLGISHPEGRGWQIPHLVFELLTELQGDGEIHEGVVEPGDHALHLVHMADFQAL